MDALFGKGAPFADINPEHVTLLAQFVIFTCGYDAPGESHKVKVAVVPALGPDHSEPPFEAWMTACEYLIACVAKRSNAGYEKACELLLQGAMSYRNTMTHRPPSDANEEPWTKPPTPEG